MYMNHHIPEDIVDYIPKSVILHDTLQNNFLKYEDDQDLYWFSLGREICNLWHIFSKSSQILCWSFGVTSKIYKLCNFDDIFTVLKGTLDSLIITNYYDCKKDIYNNELCKRFNIHSLMSVFYGNADEEIKRPESTERRKKYLTDFERRYISIFIQRFREYIEHINDSLPNIPNTRIRYINKIKTTNKRAITKLDKLTVELNNTN